MEFAITTTVNRATEDIPSKIMLYGVAQREHVSDVLKEMVEEQNGPTDGALDKVRSVAAEKKHEYNEYESEKQSSP